MMTFLQHGFVLLALPKTASTTLEGALAPYASLVVSSPPGRKHLPARGFLHELAPQLEEQGFPRDSYELVTMFREPVEWLESWWRYRAREDARPGRSTAEMSFEAFASSYISGDDAAPTPRGRPARFISAGGLVAVDRVFAVDRPDVWGRWFSERVGSPLEFGRRNTSDSRPAELSADLRADLLEHFAPEYDVWRRLQDTGEWAGARGTRLQ
ncbi:hypothetical protein EXE58_18260 [Nocardioides seonyuensis]|uniref:Gamma-glutamyl kinase n=1 Tax=Nocardioides seonyuensis TaxID=2518371 RepID=A0A4P7IID2_9ACTN|nr:hypothetical protein [Nocardioides seonyuensis]QBX57179.1 hypothetical protein EXE58_18260 [Nocardioides seonyuensis]